MAIRETEFVESLDRRAREIVDRCTRCGACAAACPETIITAGDGGFPAVDFHRGECTFCGACADACPVKIDIPKMLIALRREVGERRIAPWPERLVFALFARVVGAPVLYRLAAPLARLLQRPWVRGGAIRRLPLAFGAWTRARDLPPVATRTFRERWRDLERES